MPTRSGPCGGGERRAGILFFEEATRDMKGACHKIRHASDLPKRIDREKVQKRGRHCAHLFDRLLKLIQKA
jgi:hypothetical protein